MSSNFSRLLPKKNSTRRCLRLLLGWWTWSRTDLRFPFPMKTNSNTSICWHSTGSAQESKSKLNRFVIESSTKMVFNLNITLNNKFWKYSIDNEIKTLAFGSFAIFQLNKVTPEFVTGDAAVSTEQHQFFLSNWKSFLRNFQNYYN